jgi:hypothetical protein
MYETFLFHKRWSFLNQASNYYIFKEVYIHVYGCKGARGSVVGLGTMLQAGRSPVQVPDEVDFSIYLILPAALWPWNRLSL